MLSAGTNQIGPDVMAGQLTNSAPVPQISQPEPRSTRSYKRGSTTAVVFGSLTLTFAILYFVIDIARMAVAGTHLYGPGLWFSAVFIVCGIIGILAGTRQTNGYIVTVLILSVITTVLIFTSYIIVSVDTTSANLTHGVDGTAFLIVLIVLGILGCIASLGQSITACTVLCDCCTEKVVYVDRNAELGSQYPPQPQRYVPEPGVNQSNRPLSEQKYMHLIRPPVPSAPDQAQIIAPGPGQRPAEPLPEPAPPYEDPPEYCYIDELRWSPFGPAGSPPSVAPPQRSDSIDGGYLTPYGLEESSHVDSHPTR